MLSNNGRVLFGPFYHFGGLIRYHLDVNQLSGNWRQPRLEILNWLDQNKVYYKFLNYTLFFNNIEDLTLFTLTWHEENGNA